MKSVSSSNAASSSIHHRSQHSPSAPGCLRAGPATPLLALLVLFLVSVPLQGQTPQDVPRWSSSGPAGHAPMGVMGDHTHSAGEWMLSYMFTREVMTRLREGRNRVDPDAVYAHFPMVPLEMTMDMHMGHVMYAPTDRVTLMAMVMWMDHQMDARMANSLMPGHGGHGDMGAAHFHEHGPDAPSHTHAHGTSGWADSEVSALVKLLDRNRRRVHLNLGLGIPTGSVDAEDARMQGSGHERLPYPMQLGSGSWEARPGVTFLQQTDRLSLGAQGMGAFRLNDNDAGYRLGRTLMATGWAQLRGSEWVAPGVRLAALDWGAISGSDPALDPTVTPENDPGRQGGKRLSGFASLNFQVPRGTLAGHRLAVEWGGPLVESLDGPQLGGGWVLNLGWEYAL
jgi:hypothetical protein